MAKNKTFSLASQGLNYKLKIAFYLMSVLPLLVCLYLVSNYILPTIGIKLDIAVSIITSIFIAIIGFFLIKEVFRRILSVSTEAKLIAAGDISRKVSTPYEDEIGDLGSALNQLTDRIRSNMDELKSYSEKTSEINLEIQKRVLILSSLLQISSLISQSAKLDDILKFATEKSRLLANSDVAYLLFREEGQEEFSTLITDGINSQYLLKITLGPQEAIFNKLTKTNKPLILDKKNILPENLRADFYKKFKLINTLIFPVYLRGRVAALLGVGNFQEGFLYKKDDIELLDVFAKQMAIAVENDILMHRVEKLEIKDALTGLYNETFIRNRLQEEIRRAIIYQRPCAFILLNIDGFQRFREKFGSLQAESVLKRTASLIRSCITEIERVARSADNEFSIVLPEKNKRQALEIAESIRKKIEFGFSEETDINKKLTVSGSISENPLDGVEAEELIAKAKSSLSAAKMQGKNRIVI